MGRLRRDPPWTPSGILIKFLSFLGSEMHKLSDGRRWRSSICPILSALSFRERIRVQCVAEGPTSLKDKEVRRCLSRLLHTVCERLSGQGCRGVGSWGKAAVDACSPLDFHSHQWLIYIYFAVTRDTGSSSHTHAGWSSSQEWGPRHNWQAASSVGTPFLLCPLFDQLFHHTWLPRVSPTALPGGATTSKDFCVWKNYDCLSLSSCKTAWRHGKAERSSQGQQ